MKRVVKISFVMLLMIGFLAGCESCFDDALTNKVDAPNFAIQMGTDYDIVLESETRGASIKYTTDGSDPTTSETAVDAENGVTVTIDFYTTLKAYAYKEAKRDSETHSFTLPRWFSRRRKVTYNTDYTVKEYLYKSKDVNDKEKLEILYTGKGSDNQWFTSDDVASYYYLHKYEDGKLTVTNRYNAVGADGSWLTSDDTLENYSEYTYDGDNIVTRTFKESDGTELGKAEYSYTSEVLETITYDYPSSYVETYDEDGKLISTSESGETVTYTYDGTTKATASSDGGWSLTYQDEDVRDYYFEYERDESGKVTKKTKKLGYGSDTNWGGNVYTYNEDATLATDTRYWDVEFKNERFYYEYEYENGLVSKKTKYKSSAKDYLRYWVEYSYDSSDRVTLEDIYNLNSEKELYKEYVYSTDDATGYVTTYQRPEVSSVEVEFHVWASATEFEYTKPSEFPDDYRPDEEDVSYIVSGGYIYEFEETEGLKPLVEVPETQEEFVESVKAKAEAIVEGLDLENETSVTIEGSEGGDIQIMIATRDNNFVNVVFEFNDYNDGDFVIDGYLDLEFQGVIDLSGKINGDLYGFVDGVLYVADANPDFTNEEYSAIAYTVQTFTDGKLTREVEYKSSGTDADWTQTDDNSIKYVRLYAYSDAGDKVFEAQYKGDGDDNVWNSETVDNTAWTSSVDDSGDPVDVASIDDTLDYRIRWDYSVDPVLEIIERDYGLYGKTNEGTPEETLEFTHDWRHWWDLENIYEIDWDDEYWQQDVDDEDLYTWTVE